MTPRIGPSSLYGTLGLLILATLDDGPRHGLAVARRIHEQSDDELLVEEGALYPALHRLEADGLIAAEWGRSENNRRARIYTLTSKGRAALERERDRWQRHVAAVARTLGVEAG
jgi:transcriptional regulator